MAGMLAAMSAPVLAVTIDLSQLCGAGNCVVQSNTTIGSASGSLNVAGDFTVNPGVVLEFLVPVNIKVSGNMVLSGTVGAPGNGGDGGSGGGPAQPGGVGGNAPSVASGIFDVRGTITLNAGAAAVAEGGEGGAGGWPGFGAVLGGAGGAGGAAGSLTFNSCSSFTSASGARILVNGGAGGVGQAGTLGGVGGAGGAVVINAQQGIVSNALVSALGGAGGLGGAGSGVSGADGSIALRALGPISVGTGTLNAGANTPSISPLQLSVAGLAFCSASALPVPTGSDWALLLLASLMAMFATHRLRRRFGPRSTRRPGV